ncbi:hypothetical protein EVAR_85094_1 [Eumeta japonica]|uniref:Uncharacterized protein n=1 Tax=Eumeta variegata TaxID=151549 RepID=A0A4C1XUF3_EUMVA|nr:hypothetical protein EVAR_85094_1 [Eumeta japonica]
MENKLYKNKKQMSTRCPFRSHRRSQLCACVEWYSCTERFLSHKTADPEQCNTFAITRCAICDQVCEVERRAGETAAAPSSVERAVARVGARANCAGARRDP